MNATEVIISALAASTVAAPLWAINARLKDLVGILAAIYGATKK